VIRDEMSRSDRSVSARASSSRWDCSSSSIRRALSIAIAAWSASAPRRFASSGPNVPGVEEKTASVPSAPRSETSGAIAIARRPISDATAASWASSAKRGSPR
jgi:hypothetical protein